MYSFQQDINAHLAPDVITAITPVPTAVSVPDSNEKYIIRTRRTEYFLAISAEIAPLLVQRGANRQKEIRAHLRGLAAEPIELPVFEGFTDKKSYAVWLKRTPLSSIRLWSKIEIMMLAPRVYRWIRDIGSQTSRAANHSQLVSDLERLQQVAGIPKLVGIAANKAAEEFRARDIPLLQVAQHGDLGIGNILKAPTKAGFIVIDWPGAQIDGIPYFDLVTFSMSINTSKSRLRREIAEYSRQLGCNPRHVLAYVLSGLGALHAKLEHFPEKRFIELCERMSNFLQPLTAA